MATSGQSSMPFWIKFFKDAGVPAGEAAAYAVTFQDNRITTDMLLDLNKEYLNDMGITMLGDVISILKHAKIVHTQTAREKALKSAPVTPSDSPTATRRQTPASRIVDHYLGTASDPDARPMNQPVVKIPSVSAEMAARLGPTPAKSPNPGTIRLKTTPKEEVPVPKVRRVLPEHEGKYKITMPSGTTARSKQILQKHGLVKKSSVFDRLGGSSDSDSSSPTPKLLATGTKLTTSASDSSLSSVFNRLGGKTIKRPAESTSFDPEDQLSDSDDGDALAYAGVLKQSPSKKPKLTLPKVTFTNNLAASSSKALPPSKKSISDRLGPPKEEHIVCPVTSMPVDTAGVLSPFAAIEKKSITSRLGNQDVSSSTMIMKTITYQPPTGTKSAAASLRLGPQRMEVSSSEESSIFKRLGKQH